MSETKWTPGPWSVAGTCTVYAVSEDGVNIFDAQVQPGYAGDRRTPVNEITANAQLIAAAPELYEALEKMVEDDFKSGAPDHYQRTASARAALAKARGETHE